MPSDKHEAALKNARQPVLCGTWEKSQELYSTWSKSYDDDVEILGYSGIGEGIRFFKKYIDTDSSTTLLDVGAGTGLMGMKLRNDVGFKGHLDLLDPNLEMLQKAIERGLNPRNLFIHCVDKDGNLPIKDQNYDVITCMGSFSPNHIPPTGFKGLYKAVKRGGMIVLAGASDSLYNAEYRSIFSATLQELVDTDQVKIVDQSEMIHFTELENFPSANVYVIKRL